MNILYILVSYAPKAHSGCAGITVSLLAEKKTKEIMDDTMAGLMHCDAVMTMATSYGR